MVIHAYGQKVTSCGEKLFEKRYSEGRRKGRQTKINKYKFICLSNVLQYKVRENNCLKQKGIIKGGKGGKGGKGENSVKSLVEQGKNLLS